MADHLHSELFCLAGLEARLLHPQDYSQCVSAAEEGVLEEAPLSGPRAQQEGAGLCLDGFRSNASLTH